jgi:hypothetical protein
VAPERLVLLDADDLVGDSRSRHRKSPLLLYWTVSRVWNTEQSLPRRAGELGVDQAVGEALLPLCANEAPRRLEFRRPAGRCPIGSGLGTAFSPTGATLASSRRAPRGRGSRISRPAARARRA